MTLRVYRLDTATGERTEVPHVDPSPVLSAGITQTYPPCTCRRCLPRAVAPTKPIRRSPEFP